MNNFSLIGLFPGIIFNNLDWTDNLNWLNSDLASRSSQGKIVECCNKVTALASGRGMPYFQALEALAKEMVTIEEGGTLMLCSELGLAPEVQTDLILVKTLLWAKDSDTVDVECRLEEARKRQFPETLLARCGDSKVDADAETKKYEAALNDDCTICLQKLKDEDIYKTACGHFFHTGCIERWNKEKKVCPICNDGMNMTRQKTIWKKTAATIEEQRRGTKRPREEEKEKKEREIIDVDAHYTDFDYATMLQRVIDKEKYDKEKQLREDEELARSLVDE